MSKATKVFLYPSKTLRTRSEPVTAFNKADSILGDVFTPLYRNMLNIMTKLNGAGLAAIQIGVPLQAVMIAGIVSPTNNTLFLLNPKISGTTGDKVLMKEGCLSVPGVEAKMHRDNGVIVEYQDEEGTKKDIKLTGAAAQCIQHEIDHINGKLCIDYFNEEDQQKIKDLMLRMRRSQSYKELRKTYDFN